MLLAAEEPEDADFDSEDDEDDFVSDEDDEDFASDEEEDFDVAGLLLDDEPRLSFR